MAMAFLGFALLCSAHAHAPLIIDTDMNVDDMAAIAYLLKHHDNILAITVSAVGFSAQYSGVDNALRLLHHYNRSEIPVAFQDGYLGQTKLNEKYPSGLPPQEWLQGTNEYFTKWVPLLRSPQPPAWQSAGQLIVETLKSSAEPVHFLELGPYTNLAAALHRDGSAKERVKRIYAEGGRLQGGRRLRYPWTTAKKPQTASWNVFLDAISAAQVLAAQLPVTLLADNACDALVVSLEDLKVMSCREGEILAEIMSNWGPAHDSPWSSLKYWDQATAVLLMDLLEQRETSCEQWLSLNLTVNLQDDESYATFREGVYGAPTEACVASNRNRFLRSFYAC